MTGGVVTGGWGFVWGAYALTFTALVVYGIYLLVKLRKARANEEGEVNSNG
jgi:hypothetical protein